jgi:hypothetical protein
MTRVCNLSQTERLGRKAKQSEAEEVSFPGDKTSSKEIISRVGAWGKGKIQDEKGQICRIVRLAL